MTSDIKLLTAGIVFGSMSFRPKLSEPEVALSASVIGPPSSKER